jgi:hypothetical protein
MARSKQTRNGRLEEALAILIQNQASFLARVSEMDRINSERFARIQEQFQRIEAILFEHSRILAEHGRLLAALPEAIRDKIGFRTGQETKAG